MQLVVGTLSTWSLRAFICARLANIQPDLILIDLEKPGYKAEVLKYSPTGLVPALLVDDFVVCDSLAIVEYFNECSDGALYPREQSERAQARSLCMEMHSGFVSLRSRCPFTFEKIEPLADFNGVIQEDIERIKVIFAQAKGLFMFDKAGAVDAFFAILAFRLDIYGICLDGKAGDYQRSLLDWPLLKNTVASARHWSS